MEQPQKYAAPTVSLAGEVQEVVLGGIVGGGDFYNEALIPGGGFFSDEDPADSGN